MEITEDVHGYKKSVFVPKHANKKYSYNKKIPSLHQAFRNNEVMQKYVA